MDNQVAEINQYPAAFGLSLYIPGQPLSLLFSRFVERVN